jgi:hypothetical protein
VKATNKSDTQDKNNIRRSCELGEELDDACPQGGFSARKYGSTLSGHLRLVVGGSVGL